jgi:SAM-dependent methyltransferase
MTATPDPDTAIALRRAYAFPPRRRSVLEDPADEKSAHGSQRYSSLMGFYGDRDPSWYASVTREFEGCRRVLDLGAGPGLALGALADHGVSEPIGVDRWRGFARDAEAAGRVVVLHDLTLPMPFFRSGAFDGIFSHYTLDYISPIGVQQVLLEARRLLAPGGQMVLYLAGVGLTLGDLDRTSPFGEPAFTGMLAAAGFEGFGIETTADGRNTVVRVERAGPAEAAGRDSAGIEGPPGGEAQLSAGIRLDAPPSAELPITLELSGGGGSVEYRPRAASGIAPSARLGDAAYELAICARLIPVSDSESELQLWSWLGAEIAAADTLRLSARPEAMRLRLDPGAGSIEHQRLWRPRPAMLEEPGDPYAPLERALPPQGSEGGWEPRARRVVVERQGDDPGRLAAVTDSKDQFLIRRPDPAKPDMAALERDWLAGKLHGIVLGLDAARRPESLSLSLWASFRGALLYLEPDSWGSVDDLAGPPASALRSPLLLVDPALSGRGSGGEGSLVEAEAALERLEAAHLVLAAETAAQASPLLERHPTRILISGLEATGGGPPARDPIGAEAGETLRYLTERTTLMRFRSSSVRAPAELGRRSRFTPG